MRLHLHVHHQYEFYEWQYSHFQGKFLGEAQPHNFGAQCELVFPHEGLI